MTRTIINGIVRHVQNFRRIAYLLDTSFITGNGVERLDFDYLSDVHEAVSHVTEINRFFEGNRTLIIPVDVEAEIDSAIQIFKRAYKGSKADTKRDQPKCRAIHQYVTSLVEFRNRSQGHDPRYSSVGNVGLIDAGSEEYQKSYSYYARMVAERHSRKDCPSSAADIAINTLAHLIQKRGIDPCILTKDNDFEAISQKARTNMHLEEVEMRDGILMRITGNNYERFIYRNYK